MLNIIIPMAGAGNRFAANGYRDPKPLIPVGGIPMIRVVINNLCPRQEHCFTFICQQAHIDAYNLRHFHARALIVIHKYQQYTVVLAGRRPE